MALSGPGFMAVATRIAEGWDDCATMTTDLPEGAAVAIAAAERVTRQSASNLWFVGRCLPNAKRRLFEAAYAGMRVIDDFVDEEFMRRTATERRATRKAAHACVDAWYAASAAAIETGSIHDGGEETADWVPLYRALAHSAGTSDLTPLAWSRLAHAMHWDIDERPIRDWDDFLAYCEGATVAPASVFLYVLQAGEGEGGLQAGVAGERLFDQARDMAVFCYLVHIVRDLRRDAAVGGQLVTLPEDMLARHGLARDAMPDDPETLQPLIAELLTQAADYRAAAERMRDTLLPGIGRRERAVLNALLSIYGDIHDRLGADPEDPVKSDRSVLEDMRTRLLERFGLAPDPVTER